ncbi:Uncharacterized conserved protein PhnB, glyoxalase superfamily [Pseudarcicella hirudinis]|uniref:Uncharacterized conserved protein PhnB, glyoxalase superfamily n=1 Tax=Pseudarcicella hirudinis TaxID=1079859 RepID=A0A1I5WZ67_9BACT|nr:VOC family protein [Pseudarcicella hirudinis]SFQ24911.1 Uncharacterized conserved protein PhnB, glyoxalase superfamily [Pseudarcicella hirudinis]
MKIPEGHQSVMPYLMVNGAVQFLSFLENVFQAEKIYWMPREDGSLMHAEVNIHGSTIMFSESQDPGDNLSNKFFIYVENADETYQKALDSGAKAISDLANKEYGRSGGVIDPFGITWWITSTKE